MPAIRIVLALEKPLSADAGLRHPVRTSRIIEDIAVTHMGILFSI